MTYWDAGKTDYKDILEEVKSVEGVTDPEELAAEILAEIEKLTSEIYVTFAQNGDRIDKVESLKEGIEYVERLEEEDRQNGNFEPGYYSLESSGGWTLWNPIHKSTPGDKIRKGET